jgi:hypothetical protein
MMNDNDDDDDDDDLLPIDFIEDRHITDGCIDSFSDRLTY